jgi:putative ABC transport system permease protein
MNIMIVSVTEHGRGTKSIRAKRSTVAIQFIETMIIGQLGGLVGIILGILIGYGTTALDFVFVIPWGAILPHSLLVLS